MDTSRNNEEEEIRSVFFDSDFHPVQWPRAIRDRGLHIKKLTLWGYVG